MKSYSITPDPDTSSRRMQDLPVTERPYEKFEQAGAANLSDAELLAILLRSGTRGQSALDLAYTLLNESPRPNDGLAVIKELSYEELRTIPGIGKVKAMQLLCTAEIARRLVKDPAVADDKPLLNTPQRVNNWLQPQLADAPQEQLLSLLLDTRNRLIRSCRVSLGSLSEMIITPREVFREAIRANAAGVILAHNHPSGSPVPSSADLQATAEMLEAARLIGIRLLDHIVLGREGYVSLRASTSLWEA